MSAHQVEFHAKGAAETIGLPADAFTALVETLQAITRDPWTHTLPDDPDEDTALRWAPFGGGLGAVHLRIDDQHHAIRIYGVTWAG